LPQAIAAFLAGVLISEQGKNLAPLSEIRPFRDLFLVLFFVLTGMLLNFQFFIDNLSLVISISLAIILVKFSVIYLILRFASYSPSASVFVTSYLSNVGEFTIVISQIALTSAAIGMQEYNLVLSVFILSLVFIPFLLKYARGGAERVARLGVLGRILPQENGGQDIKPAQIFENHVVICGHGRVGRETRSMLDLASIPYVVIDFNKKVISDLAALSRYAIYGDPTDLDILKASFIEQARVLVIAVPDTFSQKRIIDTALKLNPKIIIICRSHIEGDRYDLINMGVNTIIMPELEAGLRIGSEVLDLFNVNQGEIDSFVKRLRRQHLL
jgi:CPA2 family monovalent cation:H+ antiporter-2